MNRFTALSPLAAFLLLGATSAEAAMFRVGSDGACTHSSIQAAIDAAQANGPGDDLIFIVNTQTFTQQALTIEGQLLLIAGGFADCNDNNGGGADTVIDGAGGVAESVIAINQTTSTRSSVYLWDLEIRGGENGGDGQGGGIDLGPNSRVDIFSSRIVGNSATIGGAIYMVGEFPSNSTTLSLQLDTMIENNTATGDGGGIACDVATYLAFYSGAIRSNIANRGGGIFNCGMDGRAGGAERGIHSNYAASHGGGIYADRGQYIFDFNVNEGHGPSITANTAGGDGGGAYLSGAGTNLFGKEMTIEGNNAGGHGGGIFLTSGANFMVERRNAAGTCPNDAHCNRITGNNAGTSATLPAGAGGAVYVGPSSVAHLRQVYVSNNSADEASVVAAAGPSSTAWFNGAVVTGNISANPSAGVISAAASSQLFFDFSTIAGNNSSAIVKANDSVFYMNASIVRAAQGVVLSGNAVPEVGCVMAHETTSIPAGPSVVIGDPLFADAGNGDFRLLATSPAIDFCAQLSEPMSDVNLFPRGVDDSAQINLFGPYDLGAFESKPDVIFANGFQSP